MTGKVIVDRRIAGILEDAIKDTYIPSKMTVSQLAAFMGISRTQLHAYLNGSAKPKKSTIILARNTFLILVETCDRILNILE